MTLPPACLGFRAIAGAGLVLAATVLVWLTAPVGWPAAVRPAIPVVAAESGHGLVQLAQRIRRGPTDETPEPPAITEPQPAREPEFRQTQQEADRSEERRVGKECRL